MYDNTERVTIVEDNDFLSTDVSELVEGIIICWSVKPRGLA